ncbi:D-glycerate 3-kinase [Luteibacter sp. Sphag1AF]|uniref:kinase n=1 Tax=Luteibacter sp. Sphag1AF TaxID=2587031 RepID=UPI0017CDFA90|nr:D-glycerate 3-kinase [Luteibacter sp. Sphag1AF]
MTLLSQLEHAISDSPGMFVLGLSGLQGSGKSTLSSALAGLANARGWHAAVLSLDDVYLTRAQRQRLAADVHPLLMTRGVPGTHDLGLLNQVMSELPHASPAHPVALPRFDKGMDDRAPADTWPVLTRPPRLLILEGWCVGVPVEDEVALATPVNALERDEDPDGRWREWVNQNLVHYQPLWRRLDALIVLLAPSWDIVLAWRSEAEQKLRQSGAAHTMDAQAMRRFVQHYERISRLAMLTLPSRADILVPLDESRHVMPGPP